MSEEFLTLFEKERGYAFKRRGQSYGPQDVKRLKREAYRLIWSEGLTMSDAAERVAPNVWDESANLFVCTYDLRQAIIRKLERQFRMAKHWSRRKAKG